jgi:hypothetical protein
VAIFTFTSYDDDRAYDMKLGSLLLLRCFCFMEMGWCNYSLGGGCIKWSREGKITG